MAAVGEKSITYDARGLAEPIAEAPRVAEIEDGVVALASEEIAIRALIDHEIETYDPYEREVLVWSR